MLLLFTMCRNLLQACCPYGSTIHVGKRPRPASTHVQGLVGAFRDESDRVDLQIY